MDFVFILILVLVLLYTNQDVLIDMFSSTYQTFQSYVPINGCKFQSYPLINSLDWFYRFFPTFNAYTNLPWWNTPLGTTSNMSYDLRGDPLVIPKKDFVWNNSSTIPIYNSAI
jgi:hypothetical protein